MKQNQGCIQQTAVAGSDAYRIFVKATGADTYLQVAVALVSRLGTVSKFQSPLTDFADARIDSIPDTQLRGA